VAETFRASTITTNGGHWFFTQIVSSTPESAGGPFAGCFAGVANTCYEGIAVTVGPDPFGPYGVYFLNANYDPSEPGYPCLLNDFAKIATTRDAFLLFYNEYPQFGGGLGGGFFNEHKNLRLTRKLSNWACPSLDVMESQTLPSLWPSRTWVSCRRQTEPAFPIICFMRLASPAGLPQFRR
jgi:hypothetical protein